MKKLYSLLITGSLLLFFADIAFCQQPLVSANNKKELDALSAKAGSSFARSQQQALSFAKSHGWMVRRKTKKGGIQVLQGVNKRGFPVYFATDDNVISAATTNTNTVHPGGSLGLNLSGSSAVLNNKLAIWDGGAVYKFHQEFSGKTITIKDTSSIIDHATHVGGTMLAKGVYPPVKGMAFNATTLLSYDFNNDVAEMSAAAATNLLLSNHSYGELGGWVFDDGFNRWEWYGLPGDTVDYTFGFYGDHTQAFDQVAYKAPYYLIVEAAGNARSSTGPPVGQDYYGYKSASDPTWVDKGPRPDSISSNNSYDCISSTANAKNILTVGAVNPLPYGPANSQSITTAYFSSWGPTDDGRVKPDIVGNGLNVLSTGSSSTTSYITLSGTSQAAPNITGSLYLLQEYYAQKYPGTFMRAATLKGLACHTAFDAGNVGPDYIYGWGLLDMKAAAQAITDNGTKSMIKENTLSQGATQTFNVVASGNGALVATISWTDPAGSITPDGVINDRTPKLVNDLDIRVSDGTNTFMPWVLDPNNPSAAATTGDNVRDNLEQVYLAGAIPGKSYTIRVSHKGALTSGSQAYSLIVTGIGGSAYCASSPLSSADSRIDNVTISNINNTPPAGCTTYSDYTNLTIQLEQNKTYPLSLTVGTCGLNLNKIAKVFIDWNGNGVFDANEQVATTPALSGGSYTTQVKVPSTVVPGNFSLMRVVMVETSDSTVVHPCGTYPKGETQDYRVQFLQTSLDAGVIAVVNPSTGGNCSGSTPVTITLKNFGSQTITNIPLTVTITAPNNTVTTFNQVYTASLAPLSQDNFTFNNVFNITSGSTYTITATASLAGDLVPANNGITTTVAIDNPPTATDLSANYCNVADAYLLTGAGDGELLWYKNSTDTYPFAYGSTVLTAQAPVANTYYVGLNDFSGTVGPATKNVFTTGGYNQFTPEVNVFTRIPVVIESARLYIGNSGRITFNVSDASGEIVSTTSINAVATASNPSPGAKDDDPTDQGQVYNLNLLLPAAGNYSISTTYDNTATIYRSNGGVSGYPFKIGDVFGITGNTATSAGDTAYYKNFYYYFYDVQLRSPGCASASRQAVPVTKPVITQNGTKLISSAAANNQWYLNGTLIQGATGQTYTPTQSGNYQVTVSLSNGCVAQSDNFAYVILPANPGENDIGLTVFPNPASTQLSVLFAAKSAVHMNLSLINIAGENEYTDKEILNGGNFSTVINVNNFVPGTYILRLLLDSKLYTWKLVIIR